MKYFILWIYTLFVAWVWWFFVLAKVHALKFKNFSKYVDKVTLLLLILLGILTLAWYLIILGLDANSVTLSGGSVTGREYY